MSAPRSKSGAVTSRTDAAIAWVALVAALEAQAEIGRPTPCQVDPEPFTSEELRERREAARACAGCPLIEACAAFAEANGEVWHVWGGRDRRASRAGRKAGSQEAASCGSDSVCASVLAPPVPVAPAGGGTPGGWSSC